jgi:hypothetical protein
MIVSVGHKNVSDLATSFWKLLGRNCDLSNESHRDAQLATQRPLRLRKPNRLATELRTRFANWTSSVFEGDCYSCCHRSQCDEYQGSLTSRKGSIAEVHDTPKAVVPTAGIECKAEVAGRGSGRIQSAGRLLFERIRPREKFCNDARTTSARANPGSRVFSGAGTAITRVPAEFADRTPASESSTATHRSGRTPSKEIVVQYTAGSGFPAISCSAECSTEK